MRSEGDIIESQYGCLAVYILEETKQASTGVRRT